MRLQTNSSIDKEETEANSLISDLINNINILVDRKDPLIKCIKSPKLLIRGLTDLINMVEMIDIKQAIVRQVKFLITNQARKENMPNDTNQKFEGHMLHTVISGNSGMGKSTVGLILAKIWMALGFVKKKDDKKPGIIYQTGELADMQQKYQTRISELEESQRNDHRKLDKIKELLSRYHNVSGEIRRQLIKLKPVPILEFDSDWEVLLCRSRELRFGFDEIIREVNQKNQIPTEVNIPSDQSDPYENSDPKFIIAAREDLIAEYLGQTAPKTKKVLESARGGVLFIDEAYSLCPMDQSSSRDKYGEECLTTINEFMSLYPDEIIIIFAGYKDKLLNSIFKVQPGLLRRCAYFFEIQDYTPRGLAKIFTKQLAKNSWTVSPNINMEKIISANKNIIQDGGGGTEKLAFFVKTEYGMCKFKETVEATPDNPVRHDSIITEDMIKAALNHMKKQISDRSVLDICPTYMYS